MIKLKLLRANEALKKYSRRSKAAKAVDKQMWNVVLAGGCWNKLDELVKALERRYAREQMEDKNGEREPDDV